MWCCERPDGEDPGQRSILFSILNGGAERARRRADAAAARTPCSRGSDARRVYLRSPRSAFKAASDVLAKTFRFVKNVPCFRGLPPGDQLRLVRGSWAPLLVLGLVQDSVRFGAAETRQSSWLHKILTQREGGGGGGGGQPDPGVAAGDVERVNTFLDMCGAVGISVDEFAFLKGAILFTSDATELECRDYIHSLQREAERALYAHARTVPSRLGELRLILIALRSVDPDAVAGLFFRPVTGTGVDEHVLAMFLEEVEPT